MLQFLAGVFLACAVVVTEPAKTVGVVPIDTKLSESVSETVEKTPEADKLHSMPLQLRMPHFSKTPGTKAKNDHPHIPHPYESYAIQPEIWTGPTMGTGPTVDNMEEILNKQLQQRYELDRKYEEENKLMRTLVIAELKKRQQQMKQLEDKRNLQVEANPFRNISKMDDTNAGTGKNNNGFNVAMNNERNSQRFRSIMNTGYL